MIPRTTSARRCSAFTVTVALVLFATVVTRLPVGARASAIRTVLAHPATDDDGGFARVARHRRDIPTSLAAAGPAADVQTSAGKEVTREKRTLKLIKLKPLVVLPAKVALGTGAKLIAGAKLGAKAVGLGTKALGVGVVGLKAVSKVAKVTVKAATALGVKAVLLNFLFKKINQVIDFKTRLLSNLDQRNKQQNAQFLSPILPSSSKSGSIGNKDDDDFLAASPGDQQVLAQEQSKTSVSAPPGMSPSASVDDDEEVTFDPNKVSLQVPDRLFGPSFTAVNSISQTIGNVIQNTATRLARLVDALKAAIFRKVTGVSSISNSSGGSAGANGGSTANRGSRDLAADLGNGDGLDSDPLDEAAASAVTAAAKKRDADSATDGVAGKQ